MSKGMKSGRITRRAEMGKTPLSEIFRGQLRSRLQRADEESTDNVQPFFTLQLDIEVWHSIYIVSPILSRIKYLDKITEVPIDFPIICFIEFDVLIFHRVVRYFILSPQYNCISILISINWRHSVWIIVPK